MMDGNVEKFRQNEALLGSLFPTAESGLDEASLRDRISGIGLRQDDPRAMKPAKWQRTNLLGSACRVQCIGRIAIRGFPIAGLLRPGGYETCQLIARYRRSVGLICLAGAIYRHVDQSACHPQSHYLVRGKLYHLFLDLSYLKQLELFLYQRMLFQLEFLNHNL